MTLPRRKFLRGSGVTLALPFLECMRPAFAAEAPVPRRMLIIANNLGVLPKYFFPTTPGRGYELSPYLSALADFRDDFTVFSGVSHPGVTGGHSADNCLLTAARGAFTKRFARSEDRWRVDHTYPPHQASPPLLRERVCGRPTLR